MAGRNAERGAAGPGCRGAAADYDLAVIGIDPRFVPALFNLAILRTRAGANEEAIGFYETIIEAEPGNAAATSTLGFS